MIVRTPEEREGIIEAGRRLGVVLSEVAKIVAPGVSTADLDILAEKLIREGGDVPAFLDYTPERGVRPYPATLCVSINNEVVHGIPNEAPRILEEGDIVALDLGLIHKGFVTDSALTVAVGEVSDEAKRLMQVTAKSLEDAIVAARPGNRIGDISHATEAAFKGSGFSVVKVLGGHGVGSAVHEEPWISNVGTPGTGPEIVEGMVLALEPIANAGKASVILAPDGYTYRSKDGSISAHFEHTILVEKEKTLVITRRPGE
ncbi:MAG: type I methionyl aminopeptidase [Candidatus Pacebacteria bacterium]|nr:type I methionyl aminopeptidase [Candidatus Paceibacterota bacterium]